jgi:hypothetical protein
VVSDGWIIYFNGQSLGASPESLVGFQADSTFKMDSKPATDKGIASDHALGLLGILATA